MEQQSEIKRITENMEMLLELTRVATQFLSKSLVNGVIFSVGDISAKPTDLGRLIQIVMATTNGINDLLDATYQSGVVSILLEARPNVGEEGGSSSNARKKRGARASCKKDAPKTDLIIGDENCPINKVVLAMLKTPVSSVLDTKWEDIALKVDTPPLTKKELVQRKLRDQTPLITVLHEILSEWRSRKDKEATLQELIKILQEENMNAIAQSLKDEFHI